MGKSIIIASNTDSFIKAELARIYGELGIKSNNLTDQYSIDVPEDRMSIGIEQIQQLKEWSLAKPYQAQNKLAVIKDAELMTTEAQNAALKLLEEPSPSNNYILVTGNYSLLLPTVLSRCELIFDNRNRSESFDLSEFLAVDDLERFQIVSRFDRFKSSAQKHQYINNFLLSLILFCRKQMLIEVEQGRTTAEIKTWLTNITVINLTKQMLDAKVPTKSALDYLLINVNLPQKMV